MGVLNNFCPDCQVVCNGKFCWLCGKKSIAINMKCPHCEKTVSIIWKFCEECGKPIQEEVKEHITRERR